jgi:prenylcysteine oxidase/farnesylcysteine lyase
MDQIHGLGAGVSMATSGAHAIRGGNWRIFKEMLDESKAGVYLNTTVSYEFRTELELMSIGD